MQVSAHNSDGYKRPAAILLLGGTGRTRYPLFERAASRRGLVVLAVDDPQPSGCEVETENASTQAVSLSHGDDEGVINQVMRWSELFDIRGVASLIDARVFVGSLAADLLGCRHPGLRAAHICSDKHLQRAFLREFGPASQLLRSGSIDESALPTTGYPYVVKPTNLHSSQGVCRVDDLESLRTAVTDRIDGHSLLLEPMLMGRECSVEAFVEAGKILFVNLTEKTEKKQGRHFICEGYNVPPLDLSEDEKLRLLELNEKVLISLQFDTGVTHAEYRFDGNGMPVLVEIAARPPGDGTLQLIRLSSGMEAEEALIALALGEPIPTAHMQRFISVRYFPNIPGRFKGMDVHCIDAPDVIAIDKLSKPPILDSLDPDEPACIREIATLKAVGAQLTLPVSDLDRCAYVIMDAPDKVCVREALASATPNITVLVDPIDK